MIQQPASHAPIVKIPGEAPAWCRGTAAEPLAGTEMILFVEDEAFVRDVTSEVLRSAGYRVLTARDAAAAERTYCATCGKVDLLLTDVVLPGENGRRLAERLLRATPGLKVLLISGYADQMRAEEVKSRACLAKPFSAGVLLQKVRQVLDSRPIPYQDGDSVKHACSAA